MKRSELDKKYHYFKAKTTFTIANYANLNEPFIWSKKVNVFSAVQENLHFRSINSIVLH